MYFYIESMCKLIALFCECTGELIVFYFSFVVLVDEWRSKWHLTGQYVDSTPDDLINDMADIQPHVRLKAIATCAKASDYKPPEGNEFLKGLVLIECYLYLRFLVYFEIHQLT